MDLGKVVRAATESFKGAVVGRVVDESIEASARAREQSAARRAERQAQEARAERRSEEDRRQREEIEAADAQKLVERERQLAASAERKAELAQVSARPLTGPIDLAA